MLGCCSYQRDSHLWLCFAHREAKHHQTKCCPLQNLYVLKDWDAVAKQFMCLAGDLHFYMRHSFRPAPAPMKANGKVANGHADDFSGNNPFAESAPSRLAAAKVLGARNASVSGSSVASSEADEAELGRDIYQDLVSLVHNGETAL